MSSSTITPPYFLCCGPSGSTRYYSVTLSGISGTCPECTLGCSCDSLNGVYVLDFLDMSVGECAADLSFPGKCGYVFLSLLIKPCDSKRATYTLTLSGTGVLTPAINIVWEKKDIESCLESQTLVFKSRLGDECDVSGAVVTVTPVPPSSMKAIFDSCFHCPECGSDVKPPALLAPKESGFPSSCSSCESEVVGSGKSLLPRPGNGGNCASGGCDVDYDVEIGNAIVKFAPPSGDPWSPIPEFTLNTTYLTPGSPSIFGKGVSSVLNQAVVNRSESLSGSIGVVKCDGCIEIHTCKAAGAGDFVPPPNSLNLLTQNADGTYTERTGDGNVFDYKSTGLLYRIKNPSNNVWTIVSGSVPNYVIDPASRRTTLAYNGSGALRRLQDPFGRLTTFTFDARNRLTQFVTPELCASNFRYYDTDDRLKEVINVDGLRTTITYTADGLCSSILQPSGGKFTFTYDSWSKTRISSPDGSQTTVKHNVARQVLSVSQPSGIRTSFAYDGGRVARTQSSTGARTTLGYVPLSNGTKGLKTIVSPTGTQTFTYDTGSRLKASIDELNNRTTYARDGSGLQIAKINALSQRTSFVYNASGQRKAQMDALGNRTSYVYNSTGSQIAEINPLSRRTTFGYSFGQLVQIKSPINAITTNIYDSNNRRTAKVDPLGNRTSFLYEGSTTPKATILPSGARTTNIFSFGRLIASVDPLGNRTSQAYDSLSRPIRVMSPMGRISTTIYNSDGRRVATIDPSSLRTSTIYDSAGRIQATVAPTGIRATSLYASAYTKPIAQISPDGTRTSFVYNAVSNLIRVQAPTGAINTTVYDRTNREVARIDSFGKRTTTLYDASGRTIASINTLSQRSSVVYDAASQAVATINPLLIRSTQVYDAAGRGVARMDGVGSRWTTVFDLASRSIASVDPLLRRSSTIYNVNSQAIANIDQAGKRSTLVYDNAQRTIASIDRLGFRSTTVYNNDSQPIASVNALGNRTTNVYDLGGRMVAIVDSLGIRSTTVFDSKGRAATSVNPLGNRWTTVFDSISRPTASNDPLGNRTSTIYDSIGRSYATVNPLGNRTTAIYNQASQILASVNSNGNRTSTVFDLLGRVTASVSALGFRNTSIYDANGRLSSTVDARNNRTSFGYSATGQQTVQIDPLNRRTTYAYDSAGQQTLRLDARGNRTSFTFSSVGLLSGRRYPDGSRTSLAYDAVGKRTLMADNSGRYTYTYDALGNSTSSKQPYGKSVTYIYDAISRRKTLNAPDAGRITYMYDAASQLTAVSNPFSEQTTYTYDDAGRRTVQRFSNGTRASFIYNSASNITQLHNRTSAGVAITTFDYKFDSVGNPVSVLEASGARVTWVYDNDNRLTAERRSGANAFVNTFTYDSTGNRTIKNADAVRTTSPYDATNQLRFSQAVGGRTTFAYDTAGNQQVEQPPTGFRTTTTWDYENRPILYRLPDNSRVTMSYNSDSRRVTKQSASETVKFVWDPGADAYLSELDVSNATQAVYTQEPQQFGKLISLRRSSISNWYHTDSLGSTRALTNASQAVTDSYLCDAWGNPISSTGTTVNPFRWVGNVGYYFDTATGLFYIRARTYQPSIARWTSVDPLFAMLAVSGMRTRDPIGFEGSPFDLYEYVGASPLDQVDPLGLEDIRVEFNAFISNRGQPTPWIPFPQGGWWLGRNKPYYAKGDFRMAGAAGTSRISVVVEIASCDIGKKPPSYTATQGVSIYGHRGANGQMIEDGARRGSLRNNSGVWKTAPCKSHYSGNQEGSDPWGPIIVTPTVNMDGQIDFAAGADLVTIGWELTHDWYPDYEVVIYVDGNQVFVQPDYAPINYTPWTLIYTANKTQSGSFSFSAKTSKCCGGTCKD